MDPVSIAATAGAALKTAQDWQGHFGFLSSIKTKLVGSPKEMLTHLDLALEQIDRTCDAFENAVASFGSLLDGQAVKTLTELSGGKLRANYEKGRGHCMIVDKIYRDHLDTWFNKAFNADYGMIKAAFDLMQHADDTLFEHLGNVARALQECTEQQLALRLATGAVDLNVIEGAFMLVIPVRKEVATLWESLRATRNGILAALK